MLYKLQKTACHNWAFTVLFFNQNILMSAFPPLRYHHGTYTLRALMYLGLYLINA